VTAWIYLSKDIGEYRAERSDFDEMFEFNYIKEILNI
jgi:hypothetical protein